MTITLNFLSGRLFISVLFSSFFLRFWLTLLIGISSSVSSCCLILCVCFYVLGISAISLSLEGVALFRRCPMGLRSTILSSHQSQGLKGCLLCGLHAVCGATAAVGCWWVGLLLGQLWGPPEVRGLAVLSHPWWDVPTGANRLGGEFQSGAFQHQY